MDDAIVAAGRTTCVHLFQQVATIFVCAVASSDVVMRGTKN